MARPLLKWLVSIVALVAPAAGTLAAQEGQTSLQKRLGDLELSGKWHYDDLDGAFAEAKQTGKPLLIVFR